MNTLTEVFENLRASGSLIGRSLLAPPWSIRYEAGPNITVVTMLRGQGWLLADGAGPVLLQPRDIAILAGPGPAVMSDSDEPGPVPTCIVAADGQCSDGSGATAPDVDLCDPDSGGRLDADQVQLSGTVRIHGRIAARLLAALPTVVVVPREVQRSGAIDLLEVELERQEPGRQAVLDRLLDLVLIGALRDWLTLPDAQVPAWYEASADPIVGPALSALHQDPAREWTVDLLARQAGVSRATLARRFGEVMGEPPISYLAGWRLCLGADMLQDTDDTIESIARRVGYSSAYAFSAAFHREYSIRPSQYRSAGLQPVG